MKALTMKALTLAICTGSAFMLSACGSDNNDNNSNNQQPGTQQPTTQTETIKGTAATGKALVGKVVVKNKDGKESSAVGIKADGTFEVAAPKGAPYLIKAYNDQAGDQAITLYSYAADAKAQVNVNQLTTQAILAANKSAEDRDYNSLAELYSNWKSLVADSSIEEISSSIDKAAKEVVANLKSVFDANGYSAAVGYPNIFKTDFAVGAAGLDKVLDSVQISGFNQPCSGTGSKYSCNLTYTVNGVNYTNQWNYSVSTDGINIELKPGGPNSIPTGNYNLKVTTTVSGFNTSVDIKGIDKPANEQEFCGDLNLKEQLPQGFVVNRCSFNGTTGNIAATVSQSGVSLSYTVKYEYSPA